MSLIVIEDISYRLQGLLPERAADRSSGSPEFRKIAKAAQRSLVDLVNYGTAPPKNALGYSKGQSEGNIVTGFTGRFRVVFLKA